MGVDVLVPIIIAVIAALPGLMALSSQRRSDEADAADKVTTAASKLVDQYQDRIAHLESIAKDHLQMIENQEIEIQSMRLEVGRLQRLVAEYQQGIAILTDQVESLGQSPRYRPAERNARSV